MKTDPQEWPQQNENNNYQRELCAGWQLMGETLIPSE